MSVVEGGRGSLQDWRVVNGIGEPLSVPRGIVESSHRALGYSVERQIEAQIRGDFHDFLASPKGAFPQSQMYQEIVKQAKDLLFTLKDVSSNGEEYSENNFRSSLRGIILEALAYGVLSARYSDGEGAVISPSETLQFYKNLNPRNGYIRRYFQKSLDRVSVPDGIVVDPDTGRIIEVLEYTVSLASKQRKQIDNQLSNISGSQNKYFKGAEYKLVAPQQRRSSETDEKLKGVAVVGLPIAVDDVISIEDEMFRGLMDELGFQARPEEVVANRHRQDVELGMRIRAHRGNYGYELDWAWSKYAKTRQAQGLNIQLPEGVEVFL